MRGTKEGSVPAHLNHLFVLQRLALKPAEEEAAGLGGGAPRRGAGPPMVLEGRCPFVVS